MKILDYNYCNLSNCNCGWNITLGGRNEDELASLKKFLESQNIEDKTDYKNKINQEKFLDEI